MADLSNVALAVDLTNRYGLTRPQLQREISVIAYAGTVLTVTLTPPLPVLPELPPQSFTRLSRATPSLGDVGLTWNPLVGAATVTVISGDLKADRGLITAVLISLFTDRRAEPGDVLPAGETDRRGWWGDAVPVVDGHRTGSRLWLLARAKNTPDTLARAREYSREALQWLVEDRVVESIEDTPEFLANGPGLAHVIEIRRPKQDPVKWRFSQIWENT